MKTAIEGVFFREFGLTADMLGDDLVYDSVPEWSSASHMMLIMGLEQEFDVEFDADEIVSMLSVGAIEQVLRTHGHGA